LSGAGAESTGLAATVNRISELLSNAGANPPRIKTPMILRRPNGRHCVTREIFTHDA